MLGAVTADIIGSRFEFIPTKEKDVNFFHNACNFTDDTVCTSAIATATTFLFEHHKFNVQLKEKYPLDYQKEVNYEEKQFANKVYAKTLRQYGKDYPMAGYGSMFMAWLKDPTMNAYRSLGNGCLMRVSTISLLAQNYEQASLYSQYSSEVTHNHSESLKAVDHYTRILWLAKTWNGTVAALKDKIAEYNKEAGLNLLTVEQYHKKEGFFVLAPDTLDRALAATLEANSYHETIENVLYIGSDTDTTGAVAGALAEYMYGLPVDYLYSMRKYFSHSNINLLKGVVRCYQEDGSLGELARNNLYSPEHKAFYSSTIELILTDPTAAWDPLAPIEESDYYSSADQTMQNNQKNLLQKWLGKIRGK